MNKKYIISVSLMTFVIPLAGFFAEHFLQNSTLTFDLLCKWFIFSAVGLRLFVAGIRQSANPAFTAREIFHINGAESFPIVRELGFANICFGLVGLISLVKPGWRIISAFASGMYYFFAALLHIVKKPASINEQIALWTDLFIFVVLIAYCVINM